MLNTRHKWDEMRAVRNFGLLPFLILFLFPLHALAETSTSANQKNLDCFAFRIFDQFRIVKRVDGSLINSPLTNHFGAPKEVKEWEEPDSRELGVTIRKKQWLFHGVRILLDTPLLSSQRYPETWLNRVEISTPRYRLCRGLKVGQPLSAFIKSLGQPEIPFDQNVGKVIYEAQSFESVGGVSFAGQATITLNIDKKMNVMSIYWEYWAD